MNKTLCLLVSTLFLLCSCIATQSGSSETSYITDTTKSNEKESIYIPSTETSNIDISTDENENAPNIEEPLYYETHIEIYEEESQEKVFDIVLTDTNFCSTLLNNFNECFDRACNEYPAYDASAADRKTRTKYRVLVQMKSFATDNPSELLSNIKICYPYGHASDIYAFARNDPFGDYLLKGGHSFIILIDEIVAQHIPQT